MDTECTGRQYQCTVLLEGARHKEGTKAPTPSEMGALEVLSRGGL